MDNIKEKLKGPTGWILLALVIVGAFLEGGFSRVLIPVIIMGLAFFVLTLKDRHKKK